MLQVSSGNISESDVCAVQNFSGIAEVFLGDNTKNIVVSFFSGHTVFAIYINKINGGSY